MKYPFQKQLFVGLIIVCIFSSFAIAATLQISDNGYNNRNPTLYNGTIAWESNVDGDWEIFYWDGTTTHQVTNNEVDDTNPSLYNGTIAWVRRNGTFYDGIYYWDGSTIIEIPLNCDVGFYPSLYDGAIAYKGYYTGVEPDHQIYYWDGAKTHEISNNGGRDEYPSLHNGKIAWEARVLYGDYYNIYYWDGNSTKKITNNNSHDMRPSLYNGEISWSNSGKIFYWNGTSTREVTENHSLGWASNPSLYNGKICFKAKGHVWYWDGVEIQNKAVAVHTGIHSFHNGKLAYDSSIYGSNNIFFWDGVVEEISITANAGNDRLVRIGENVTLTGSVSTELPSLIYSWNWELKHRDNPSLNKTTSGKTTTVTGLSIGVYDVTLTVVMDNFVETATDTMVLTVVESLLLSPYSPGATLLLLGTE